MDENELREFLNHATAGDWLVIAYPQWCTFFVMRSNPLFMEPFNFMIEDHTGETFSAVPDEFDDWISMPDEDGIMRFP